MTVIVEFSIIPLGIGISISKFLAPALQKLDKKKVRHEITSMGTIFEAKSVGEAFDLVKAAHEAVFQKEIRRVVTTIKIDDRRDVEKTMDEKVQSLKKAMRGT